MIPEKENSHKTILKATGIFGFAQVMKMIVGIVGSKFVAIFLGPIGIGTLGLLNNTISIIGSLTSFGLGITSVREVTLANSENDENKFSERITVLQKLAIIIGFLGAIITLVFSKLLSIWTFGTPDYYYWFVLLSVNFIISSLSTVRFSIMQGLRMVKSIAFSNVISSIFITVFSVPIYYFFKFNGIVAVILLSSLISLLVNYLFTRKVRILPSELSFLESIKNGIPLLKMGFLLSLNIIFGQICSYIIKIYLNGNGSSVEILGLFEVSSVILISYVGLVFSAMGTDFYPRLTSIQNDNFKVKELVNDQIEIGLLLITPAITFLYLVAPFLIQLLYTKEFLGVVLILKAALFAVIIKAIIWPLGFIILAKGETKLYFKQEIISDLFLLISTIVLYHFFGLVGIGIASFVQFSGYAFYILPVLKRKFEFNIRKETYKIIWISIAIGLLNCLMVFFLEYPFAHYPIVLIFLFSVVYSYKELDKRINIKSYYLKIRNKFKRHE
jgi:O-antigen/teichoic acid export membrane protein